MVLVMPPPSSGTLARVRVGTSRNGEWAEGADHLLIGRAFEGDDEAGHLIQVAPAPGVEFDIAVAIREAMQDETLRKAFAATLMTPVVATQAETQAMLQAFGEQWLPVVRKSGFQP